MINKKAVFFAIYIGFLAAAICGYALFQFITIKGGLFSSINSKSALEDAYNLRDAYEFYAKTAAELSAGQVFSDVITNKEFSTTPNTNNLVFDKRISLQEFADRLKTYLDVMIDKFPVDEKHHCSITIENNKIRFNCPFSDTITKSSGTEFPYRISYAENIVFDFDLHDIGLESFDMIYDVKLRCTSNKVCYEAELKNFDVQVLGSRVTLTTKKRFVLSSKIDKISFTFNV